MNGFGSGNYGSPAPGFDPIGVDHLLARAAQQRRQADDAEMLLRCLADLARRHGKDGVLTFNRDEIGMMDTPQVEWTVDSTYRTVTFRVLG